MESEETQASAITTPPRRWRLRFSLRTLVIITPLFALFFAWIGGEKLRHDQDQAAAAHLDAKFDVNFWSRIDGHWTIMPLRDQILQGRLYRPYQSISIGDHYKRYQFDEEDWNALAEFVAIEDVRFHKYHGPESGETFSRLPRVKELHLREGKLTPNDQQQIQGLQQLTALTISHLDQYEWPTHADPPKRLPRPLLAIGTQPWPQLEYLYLSGLNIPDTAMQSISNSVQLRDLSLGSCDLPPNGLHQLKNLQELRRLYLACNFVPYALSKPHFGGDIDSTTLGHLGRLEHLEELEMMCAWLHDFGGEGEDLSGRWPSLYWLKLSLSHLTKPAIVEIAAIPNLEKISLYDCHFAPEDFAAIAGASHLRELSLYYRGDNHVAVEGLAQLPQLESLTLQGDGVTDQTMKRVAKLTNLTQLTLDRTLVSDEGIAALETHPRLQRMEIRDSQVTNAALASLAKIKTLSFQDCIFAGNRIDPAVWSEAQRTKLLGKDVSAFLKEKGVSPAQTPKP